VQQFLVNGGGAIVVIRSFYEDQQDILSAIETLHCPEGFQCDVTYGNGSFWKGRKQPEYCFDLQPLAEHVVEADSRVLPLAPTTLTNLVFDPPFLTYVRNNREGNGGMIMAKRFAGYWRYEELECHYQETISEAWRVLKPLGKLVFKCQDIIHNHQMHCTHYRVIMMAEMEGFRLADMFILLAKHRLPSPNRAGKQKHARIFHSYFLVFEKNASKNRVRCN
jgi:hypothetical protein